MDKTKRSVAQLWDTLKQSFRYTTWRAIGDFAGEYSLLDWDTVTNAQQEPVAVRTVYTGPEGDVRIGGFAIFDAVVVPEEVLNGAELKLNGQKIDNFFDNAKVDLSKSKRVHQLMKDNGMTLPDSFNIAGAMVQVDKESELPTHPLSVYEGYFECSQYYRDKGLGILSKDQFVKELKKGKKKLPFLEGINELQLRDGVDISKPESWKVTIILTDNPTF
jgi:hypothetical protein